MKKFLLALAAFAALAFSTVSNAQVSGVATQVYVNPNVDCPVLRENLQTVLSGSYGVDALSRPVNANGFPVDVNGNCLINVPVQHVYYAQPSRLYVDFLWAAFAYRWMMPRTYIHIYTPGVMVYHSRPTGVLVPMRSYQVPAVNPRLNGGRYVAPGAAATVRPGAVAPAPTTVRPGGYAPVAPAAGVGRAAPPAAAPAPTRIAPAAGGVRASPFQRDSGARAPAAAPTRIAPRSSGTTRSSPFRRSR